MNSRHTNDLYENSSFQNKKHSSIFSRLNIQNIIQYTDLIFYFFKDKIRFYSVWLG